MPRIRQNAEAYARKDFQKAIGRAQVDADLTQKKMLAEASGIPYTTLWRRIENPEELSLKQVRQLLTVLPIPAEALLAFLGYQTKEIKTIKEEPHGKGNQKGSDGRS